MSGGYQVAIAVREEDSTLTLVFVFSDLIKDLGTFG